jgi:CRP-like cAMP-binding protein
MLRSSLAQRALSLPLSLSHTHTLIHSPPPSFCPPLPSAFSICSSDFVGNVTAVVSSTTQKASQFRDTLSGLRTWAVANHLPHGTAKKLLTYYEAMHTERKGFNTQDMLKHIPAHMLPKVLLEFYEPLLTAASFLHELSLSGCIDVLQRLRVDVCDIGDELIIAGTIPRTLYILWRGELQVDFPTLEPGERLTVAEYLEASEKGLPEHLRRSSTSQADSHKARKRGPQGRLDRPGTLIGFDTVFLKPQPVLYAAKAKMRCTVFAIGREELRSIMGNHRDDLPIWIKAVKHGQNILNGRRNLQAEQPSPEQKRAAATEGRMGRRGSNLPEVEGKSMESTLAAVSLPGDSSGQILTTKVEELERTVTEISEAVASQTDILKTLMEDRDGPGP